MIKKIPMGVRFNKNQADNIERISRELDCSTSDLIRYAIDLLSATIDITMDVRTQKYGIEIAGSDDGFTVAANDPRNVCLTSTLFLKEQTLADIIMSLAIEYNGHGH